MAFKLLRVTLTGAREDNLQFLLTPTAIQKNKLTVITLIANTGHISLIDLQVALIWSMVRVDDMRQTIKL